MFFTYLAFKGVFQVIKFSVMAIVGLVTLICVASAFAFKAIVFIVAFAAIAVAKLRKSDKASAHKSFGGSKYTVTTYNANTVPIKAAGGPRDW
jgi:hypothetical protein